MEEGQIVLAYFYNQDFDPRLGPPFHRAKIKILKDDFEIQRSDFDNGNIFIQVCSKIKDSTHYDFSSLNFMVLFYIIYIVFSGCVMPI